MKEVGILPRHPQHVVLKNLLDSLDPRYFSGNGALFSGGASITFMTGEYRLVDNVDFVCPDKNGFRTMYNDLLSSGMKNFAREGRNVLFANVKHPVVVWRGLGCRVFLDSKRFGAPCSYPVRMEILSENRIEFDKPMRNVFGFHVPSTEDLIALKLLSNVERTGDDSWKHRDVFDILRLLDSFGIRSIPEKSFEKACAFYWTGVPETYRDVVKKMSGKPEFFQMLCSDLGIAEKESETLCRKLMQQLSVCDASPENIPANA